MPIEVGDEDDVLIDVGEKSDKSATLNRGPIDLQRREGASVCTWSEGDRLFVSLGLPHASFGPSRKSNGF